MSNGQNGMCLNYNDAVLSELINVLNSSVRLIYSGVE